MATPPLSARLGAALAASGALHVALIASLAFLAGAGTNEAALARKGAGLRVFLAALPDTLPATDSPATPPASVPSVPGKPAAAVAGTKYFATPDLDRRPEPLTDIDPDYPADAPAGGGQLVLRLLINEQGRTDGVQVLEAEPRGAFDKAAIIAFSTALYRPGEKNGQPVKSQMTIAVTFHPERQGRPAGESAR